MSALLAEIFRFLLVVDALPYETTADVMIDGNLIKKNTVVYGSLTAIMHDAKNFSQPHILNPSRFIKEGKFVKDRRICNRTTQLCRQKNLHKLRYSPLLQISFTDSKFFTKRET